MLCPVQNIARCPALLTSAEYLAAREAATFCSVASTGIKLLRFVSKHVAAHWAYKEHLIYIAKRSPSRRITCNFVRR
jgi:hypothetical protein